MLVREGEARTRQIDERLGWSFAAIAGALNAAGFCAFGLFSSNMTGNVSALADHLGLAEGALALQALALVAAFAGGALVATLLIEAGRRRRLPGIYAYGVLAEAVLLAGLGLLDPWLAPLARGLVLSLGLSFLLGLQNATVTQITDARVRTTHVTGMVTDLGIGLGHRLTSLLDGRPRPDQGRLRLHAGTVAAFLLGGIAGVLGYRALGGFLLVGAAGLLAVLAIPGISTARRLQPF
ncbi:DUF1275 domain-containing protein [Methylobacterium organophilum]|uniref:YoaK family protein n=1 Tax=Methylobacterium organophilum TaxID=410 RepID=UPI001F13123A|nr:YoaK family protein [Methylobacterium organophilum]UMY16986.1 DUF1275 domain-containing protein [Methylobacterium organophilum]